MDGVAVTGKAAAVVIGRNEGERLALCLKSLQGQFDQIVYVDSGSTDASLLAAQDFGAHVIALDVSRPFTAARARNAGFAELLELVPEIELVQFIDGDCELRSRWLEAAVQHLQQRSDVALVCGRRREKFPEASLFNRLCDIEWDTPVGETAACGGDFLIRVADFIKVQGFTEHLIAGEEPDLCFRLRQHNRKIVRLNEEMTLHDAAMQRMSQWWQRAKRSGYADAEASARRGSQEPNLRRRVVSTIFWSAPLVWPLWPILWARMYRQRGALYATHIVAAKLPQLAGMLSYWNRWRRKTAPRLIEYK
jgi:glycosyltransferase involved in cell wall biosynthesis